jgi:hypothetical protein
MPDLILNTFDWVSPPPRSYVTDGDISIFGSGAILLHAGMEAI